MTTVQLLKRPAKLKSGKRVHYWTLRHFDSRGKAVTESIGRVGVMTKAAAEAAREDKLIAIGGGTMPRDKARKVTLAEYAGEHAAMIAGVVRRTSALEYGHSFAHAIDAIGGDVALADIGAVEVGRIREHVAAKRAPATVVKTLATLRAAFRRAVDAGLIFKNPFHRVAMPKVEVGEHRIYSADEVRAMVEAAPNLWWAALIQLAATMGGRGPVGGRGPGPGPQGRYVHGRRRDVRGPAVVPEGVGIDAGGPGSAGDGDDAPAAQARVRWLGLPVPRP
jgi:hypothetical protein